MLTFAFRRVSTNISIPLSLGVTFSGTAIVNYDYTTTGFSSVDAVNSSAVVIIPAGALEHQVTCLPIAGLTQPNQLVTLTITAASNVEPELMHTSASGILLFNEDDGGGGYGYQV